MNQLEKQAARAVTAAEIAGAIQSISHHSNSYEREAACKLLEHRGVHVNSGMSPWPWKTRTIHLSRAPGPVTLEINDTPMMKVEDRRLAHELFEELGKPHGSPTPQSLLRRVVSAVVREVLS